MGEDFHMKAKVSNYVYKRCQCKSVYCSLKTSSGWLNHPQVQKIKINKQNLP